MYPQREEDRLLTTDEAAGILGCSPAWLERGRCYGYGPKFRKIRRLVRYLRSEVIEFRDAHIIHPNRWA